MIVYKTTNLINGKCYVGQDSRNRPSYLGSGVLIERAVKRYGIKSFKKEIMAWCYTKEHLDFLEKFYINLFNSKKPDGYNLTDGGGGTLGCAPSQEKRRKLSEANRGKPFTEERKKNISEAMRGKPGHSIGVHRSEEFRKKISISSKGRPAWNKGKTGVYSVSSISKMSEAKIGNPLSEERRKNLSIFRTGRPRKPFSEEWKRKIGEGLRLYHQNKNITKTGKEHPLIDPTTDEHIVGSSQGSYARVFSVPQIKMPPD